MLLLASKYDDGYTLKLLKTCRKFLETLGTKHFLTIVKSLTNPAQKRNAHTKP